MVQGECRGGEAKLDFAAHDPNGLFLLPGLGEGGGIEILDFGGDPAIRGEAGEERGLTNAAERLFQACPELVDANTDRADDSYPGNDHLPFRVTMPSHISCRIPSPSPRPLKLNP